MSLNWTPYTEDDVDFLRMCKVDPWRHDGRNFERDYSQYSKKAYRAEPTLPGRIIGVLIITALMYGAVTVWSLVTR